MRKWVKFHLHCSYVGKWPFERAKFLLLFSRPIIFPFSLYQPPIKIGVSSLFHTVYLISHLHACVYHLACFRHPLLCFPHPPLFLSVFLSCPHSLIFSIYNIQPTFTFSNDTLQDQFLHLNTLSGGQRCKDEEARRGWQGKKSRRRRL